jgi:hypothetical protein
VWYNIYTTNRRSLELENIALRRRATIDAMELTPRRFQMLSDGGYDNEKRAAIAARLL